MTDGSCSLRFYVDFLCNPVSKMIKMLMESVTCCHRYFHPLNIYPRLLNGIVTTKDDNNNTSSSAIGRITLKQLSFQPSRAAPPAHNAVIFGWVLLFSCQTVGLINDLLLARRHLAEFGMIGTVFSPVDANSFNF